MAVNSGHGEDKTRHERKRRPRWEEANLQKLEGMQEVGEGDTSTVHYLQV